MQPRRLALIRQGEGSAVVLPDILPDELLPVVTLRFTGVPVVAV